jgi:predicted Fe-Mo cluster-binding NifX family protein
MKILVVSGKGGLDDVVSPVFGRCESYTIITAEDGKIKDSKVVKNESSCASFGAGVSTSQFVLDLEPDVVIAVKIGPKAFSLLEQAGMKVVLAEGNIREAVEAYLKGELEESKKANCGAHSGL